MEAAQVVICGYPNGTYCKKPVKNKSNIETSRKRHHFRTLILPPLQSCDPRMDDASRGNSSILTSFVSQMLPCRRLESYAQVQSVISAILERWVQFPRPHTTCSCPIDSISDGTPHDSLPNGDWPPLRRAPLGPRYHLQKWGTRPADIWS